MRAGEGAAALEAARAQVNLCIHAYRRAIGGKLEGRRRALLEEAEAKLWALEEEAGIPLQERIESLQAELIRWLRPLPGRVIGDKLRQLTFEQRAKTARRLAQLRARLEGSEVAAGDG